MQLLLRGGTTHCWLLLMRCSCSAGTARISFMATRGCLTPQPVAGCRRTPSCMLSSHQTARRMCSSCQVEKILCCSNRCWVSPPDLPLWMGRTVGPTRRSRCCSRGDRLQGGTDAGTGSTGGRIYPHSCSGSSRLRGTDTLQFSLRIPLHLVPRCHRSAWTGSHSCTAACLCCVRISRLWP